MLDPFVTTAVRRRRKAVEGRMMIGVAMAGRYGGKGCSPLPDRITEEVHEPEEGTPLMPSFWNPSLERILGLNEFHVLGEDSLGILFPIRVLEPFGRFGPLGNDFAAGLVVFVVVNEELFSG